jgi:hypothetical protein
MVQLYKVQSKAFSLNIKLIIFYSFMCKKREKKKHVKFFFSFFYLNFKAKEKYVKDV